MLEALDGTERPLPALQRVAARHGDRLLLCSDGVSDYVTDRELADALLTQDRGVAVRKIAALALAHRARDNVTAIVADVVERAEPRDGWLNYLPTAGAAT